MLGLGSNLSSFLAFVKNYLQLVHHSFKNDWGNRDRVKIDRLEE